MVNLFFSAVIAYFLGCFMFADIVSKSKGIDIKSVGTKNAGASNVYICVGKKYGVIAGLGDLLKGTVACLIVGLLFDFNPDCILMATTFVILGHLFPFYLKHKGGKGLATLLGTLIILNPKLLLIVAVSVIALTLISDFTTVGTIGAAIECTIFVIFFGSYSFLPKILFVLTCVIILFKHGGNIKRMINGEEIGFLRKNKDIDPITKEKLTKNL